MSSEYFMKMRENKKQSRPSLFLLRDYKKAGGGGEKNWMLAFALLLSLFLPFVSIAYPTNAVKRSITGGAWHKKTEKMPGLFWKCWFYTFYSYFQLLFYDLIGVCIKYIFIYKLGSLHLEIAFQFPDLSEM